MTQNNQTAINIINQQCQGPVSSHEKRAIEAGMKAGINIAINWLTIGAGSEGKKFAKEFQKDKYREGLNGGGWEEQLQILLDKIEVLPATTIHTLLSDSDEVLTDTTEAMSSLEDVDPIPEIDLTKRIDEVVTRDIQWFRENRPEQYDFSVRVVDYIRNHPDMRNIVVEAEEKTGKREIVEIITLLSQENYINEYYTAFTEKSINPQIEEIQLYGIRAEKLTNLDKAKSVAMRIEGELADAAEQGRSRNFIVHVDELDYGSGNNQSLQPLIEADTYTKVYYSATADELKKEMNNTQYHLEKFVPNEKYRGSQYFLSAGLVHESKPFIEEDGGIISYTDQALDLAGSLTDERPCGIVRLTKGNDYNNLKKFLIKDGEPPSVYSVELGCNCHFVDCKIKERFDPTNIKYVTEKTIFFVKQCWRRSTELKGHDKISFMHDHRRIALLNKTGAAYGSLSQAVSRVKHYSPNGEKINVYTDPNVFRFSVDRNVAGGHRLYNRQSYTMNNDHRSAFKQE